MIEKDLEISSLKEKIQSLERQAKFAEGLLETLPIPVFFEDAQGRYLGCNKAFADFMGKKEDEIISKTVFDIVEPSLASIFYKRDQDFIAEKEKNAAEEREMLHCDGTYHDVIFYKTLVYNGKGNVAGLIGAFIDITDRKAAENREKQYLEQLKNLATALSVAQEKERRALANELHDSVSQNLALSKLRLRMLEEFLDSALLKKELNEIMTTIDESLQCIRNQTFHLGLPALYEFGLKHAIFCLIEDLKKNHRLDVVFKNDGIPKNLDDNLKAFLFRSTQELLMNVIKHAETEKAFINLYKKGSDLVLQVSDYGKGFDAKAFEKSTDLGKSFGLLSLRTRVNFMGGDLKICSSHNRGTEVTLRVPVKKQGP